MKCTTRYILILTLGIFIGAGITLERAVMATRESADKITTPLPLAELRTLTEVFSRIKSDYVEDVEDKKLINDAIHGMLSRLDPHSTYLSKESYSEMRIGTEGQFGGLGIEVSMENGFVKVVSPIEDTPAAKAGIETGDLIVKLNDKPVKGMTLTDAVKLMRGKPGSDIDLTIVREGANKTLEITVTRAIIKIKSVKQRILEPGYGYIRVTQFQGNSGKGLKKAAEKLKKKNKGKKLKGLILDLRNNPGGVLTAAVSISDAFLSEGLIVYTEGRAEDSRLKYTATPADILDGAPMVVLINGGSASASEIVAGALQDHKRAVILGTKSFGKGSVQTILPMSGGTALKLTTARYYTPSGRSIQAKGIEPDIIVEDAKVTRTEKGKHISEADLAGHLINNKLEKTKKSGKKSRKIDRKSGAKGQDYQLNEALNLLKGVNIFGAKQ
ncbi:MAG: proteolytic complex protein CptA [Gammaproteobacteria bacterium]|nr:MAG: proteolytic complex protein CptA [Gammaproteobacteria bacterium]